MKYSKWFGVSLMMAVMSALSLKEKNRNGGMMAVMSVLSLKGIIRKEAVMLINRKVAYIILAILFLLLSYQQYEHSNYWYAFGWFSLWVIFGWRSIVSFTSGGAENWEGGDDV
jgi:hypothetical protein